MDPRTRGVIMTVIGAILCYYGGSYVLAALLYYRVSVGSGFPFDSALLYLAVLYLAVLIIGALILVKGLLSLKGSQARTR